MSSNDFAFFGLETSPLIDKLGNRIRKRLLPSASIVTASKLPVQSIWWFHRPAIDGLKESPLQSFLFSERELLGLWMRPDGVELGLPRPIRRTRLHPVARHPRCQEKRKRGDRAAA